MVDARASQPRTDGEPSAELTPPRQAGEFRPGAADGDASVVPTPAAASSASEGRRVRQDVWSRPEPKYRRRAVIMLLVNLLLFCGLCVFVHWLHFDRPFDFSWNSYVAPLIFWGEQTQNLNDFVLYPVSVEQNAMHGVVLGLLMASIVAVPIAVALLYRFPAALPFAAAVLVFAHMPWMALTLVGCCILAAVRPFRLNFRFGSALVGMLPVILYLFLATRGTAGQTGAFASPDQRLLLAAPWILAVIAACVMLAATLGISRMVRYHPAVVGLVMTVMFAAPAALFYTYVGFDEVSYRVLEAEFGPRSPRFVAQDVTERVLALVKNRLDEASRREFVGILAGRPESLAGLNRQISQWLLRELLADRRAAYEKCKEFIADYPDSRYVPNVLYIQAWVLDLRLGPARSFATATSIQRELYSDYPHVQSEEAWLALLKSYPNSPLSIAARLRLAQSYLRRGEADQALVWLDELRAGAANMPESQAATQPLARPWFRVGGPDRSLSFEPDPFLREAQRLEELIRENRDDRLYGVAPLRGLACLDPQRPGYREQLLRLAQRYPGARLHDNLLVLWAASLPDRNERAAQLEACLNAFPEGDAAAEAAFRLADLEMQARGEDQEARRQAGVARMTRVAERFPHTYWGQAAAERLRPLASPTASAPVTAVKP